MPRFETKLKIRSAQISMKFLKNNIIKKLTKNRTESNAPTIVAISDIDVVLLGMGIVELAPNPEGAHPCTIMQRNRKAIKHARSEPA